MFVEVFRAFGVYLRVFRAFVIPKLVEGCPNNNKRDVVLGATLGAHAQVYLWGEVSEKRVVAHTRPCVLVMISRKIRVLSAFLGLN